MVGRLPSPRIEESAGVTSCFGNVPLIFLNVSIVDRPTTTLDEGTPFEHGGPAVRDLRDPSVVILREDWLPSRWKDLIGEAGLGGDDSDDWYGRG